jgi:predicted RNA-binding protein with PIN domain
MAITLVIDGYNVLFQTPLMVAAKGKNDSQLSRQRLIAFTAMVLPPGTHDQTLIVFDSKQTQTEEAHLEQHPSGLQIAFASNFEEADQYIEDLIIRHPQPKTLLAVTGDGKIKATARSYGARIQESRTWYEQNLARIPISQQVWIIAGTLPRPPATDQQIADMESSGPMPDRQQMQRANRELSDDDLAQFFETPLDE